MIDFWEVVQRCSTGERMKEAEYDKLLWKNVSDLIEKFDIQSYLKDHFTDEQIKVILTPPKTKITSIIELIEQAKKAQ